MSTKQGSIQEKIKYLRDVVSHLDGVQKEVALRVIKELMADLDLFEKVYDIAMTRDKALQKLIIANDSGNVAAARDWAQVASGLQEQLSGYFRGRAGGIKERG